jgi:hypothetical protein
MRFLRSGTVGLICGSSLGFLGCPAFAIVHPYIDPRSEASEFSMTFYAWYGGIVWGVLGCILGMFVELWRSPKV